MSTSTMRLFLALWPPAAARSALTRARDAFGWRNGARPVVDAHLHVTLQFIGEVSAASASCIAEGCGLAAPRFVVRFDRVETWPNGIAALVPATPIAALERLHAALAERLATLGVVTETRRFRPHVTLARDARGSRPPERVEPVAWRVDDYALVESRGGRYRPLRVYPLVRSSPPSAAART